MKQLTTKLISDKIKKVLELKYSYFGVPLFKLCVILIMLVIPNYNLQAQLETQISNMDSATTFQDILVPEQVYLNNLEQSMDSATFYSGGGEFKNFMRFKNFWEPRLYPDKTFDSYHLALEEYYQNTYQNYTNATSEFWHELGPTNTPAGNGPVEFITFFDNGTAASTQYMLTGALQSGLFYSQDYGETWSPAGTDTEWETSGCSWAVFHPTNHQAWCASSSGNSRSGRSTFIGRTGGIYLTSDEGQTWLKIADKSDLGRWTKIRKLIWDPSNTDRLFAATSTGLYKTDNLSNSNPTWTKILNYNIFDIELKPASNNTLYISCSEKITINNENKVKWRVIEYDINGSTATVLRDNFICDASDDSYLTIEVSKAKPNFIYISEVLNSNATLRYFDNNQWNLINNSTIYMQFGDGHGFGVDQLNNGESIIVTSYTDIKIVTLTPSVSVSSLIYVNHVDVEDVIYHPYNNNEVWICTHGGPEKSVDGGNTWIAKYNGVGTGMTEKMATSFTNPEYVMLGLYHDGTQITRSPYNDNWQPTWQDVTWGDGQQPLIDNKNPRYMWSSSQKGKYRYSDDYFQSKVFKAHTTYWLSHAVLNKENSDYLYINNIIGSKEEVKRFTSKGLTNGSIISDFRNMLDLSVQEILTLGMVTPYYSNDELIVWVDARGGNADNGCHVFRTRNATAANPTWVELEHPRDAWVSDIEFHPDNTDIVYIVYGNSEDETNWPEANEFIYKVDYTNVSSPSEVDLSYNLPYSHAGPYCLEYERGSNGTLYLATDVGVFTTNNELIANSPNNCWQKFGEGLPHVTHHGIEINYPKNLLRVGTYGRGVWEIPLACSYESNRIEIEQNETWNTVKRLNKGVVVKSGNTLTIEDTRISFPTGDGIIVEAGAKLIIDNSTLNGSCNDFWQGILVQGDPLYDQFDETKQGVLVMKNDATISNSEVAVYVGEIFVSNSQSPVGTNYGNGIIKLENSHFINNQKDIVMRPNVLSLVGSGNANFISRNYINNCTFKSDANMFSDPILNKGKMESINLNGVFKVIITGNKFENLDNSINVINNWNAIVSQNSGFIVEAGSDMVPNNYNDPNEFINLKSGIRVFNTPGSNNIVKINRSEFSNVYRSIFLSGTNNAEVLLNDIEASDQALTQSGQPSPGAPYGIYINGGKGFKVEENNIHRPSSSGYPTFNGSRGIVVHKTGAVDNEIYKNTFTNLFLSQQGQCYNSGTDLPPWLGQNNPGADVGLKFFCNTSQTNESSYDLWVGGQNYCTPNSSVLIGSQRFGIAEVQGRSLINPNNGAVTDAPAGNRFSDSHLSLPTTATVDFDNGEAAWLEYWWDDLDGNGPAGWEPVRKDNVTNVERSVDFDVCPSKISGEGGSIPDLYSGLSDAQLALNSSITLLNIWQNGGDADLDEDVATTQPWDIYQQFNDLLAISPYLDEGVLIEVIQNPGFTSLMVKLLMIANPHAVNSDEVMAELEERVPPMPEAYMDEILSQPETSSQLQTLKGNLAASNHLVSSISEEIKAMYRADTENEWAKDSLINFVSRRPGLFDQYELATIYLSYGQYTDMHTVLDNIENNFEMDDEMEGDFNDYETLLNLVVEMQKENLYESSLSETEVTAVENILENEQPLTASLALSLLKRNNPEFEYNEPVYDIPEEYSMAQPPAPETIEQQYDNSEFKLYPNPSYDYTTLMYDCSYSNLTYIIMDATGREVKTDVLKTIEDLSFNEILIDLSGLSSGTYYFVVKTNKKSLFSEKLIITE